MRFCEIRYRGRVGTFSGLRGVGGVRAGEQRRCGGVLVPMTGEWQAEETVIAIVEEQWALAGVNCGGLTFRGTVKPSQGVLAVPMMQPSSSLRERAPAQHTKILNFCIAAHAPPPHHQTL
jgi:hypothetical protein